MRASDLPGIGRTITNGLQLQRQVARAIGQVQTSRRRAGMAEVPGAASLKAFLQAAIDYIDADITPADPTDPTDPTAPTDGA